MHRIPGIPLKKQGLRRSITRLPRYPSPSSGGSSQSLSRKGKVQPNYPWLEVIGWNIQFVTNAKTFSSFPNSKSLLANTIVPGVMPSPSFPHDAKTGLVRLVWPRGPSSESKFDFVVSVFIFELAVINTVMLLLPHEFKRREREKPLVELHGHQSDMQDDAAECFRYKAHWDWDIGTYAKSMQMHGWSHFCARMPMLHFHLPCLWSPSEY